MNCAKVCIPDFDTVDNKKICIQLFFGCVLYRSISAHWMQGVIFSHFYSELICMQFLSENNQNGCQILGRFSFLKSKSESIFDFRHTPNVLGYFLLSVLTAWLNKVNTHNLGRFSCLNSIKFDSPLHVNQTRRDVNTSDTGCATENIKMNHLPNLALPTYIILIKATSHISSEPITNINISN